MVVTTAVLGILGDMATTGGARAKVRPGRATTASHTAAAVSGVRGEEKDGTRVNGTTNKIVRAGETKYRGKVLGLRA